MTDPKKGVAKSFKCLFGPTALRCRPRIGRSHDPMQLLELAQRWHDKCRSFIRQLGDRDAAQIDHHSSAFTCASSGTSYGVGPSSTFLPGMMTRRMFSYFAAHTADTVRMIG
jgi:hypothetical protein